MLMKVGVLIVLLLGGFLTFVGTRDASFRYERSAVIQAPKEKIFPYISQLKLGGQWSPFEKVDPEMKKVFSGEDGQPGAKLDFESKKSGSGSVEILKITPVEAVDLRLIMTAPFKAENLIEYRLTSEGQGTRFTWTMSGNNGFLGKLMGVLIDCEKMIGDQLAQGIANLKDLVESQP